MSTLAEQLVKSLPYTSDLTVVIRTAHSDLPVQYHRAVFGVTLPAMASRVSPMPMSRIYLRVPEGYDMSMLELLRYGYTRDETCFTEPSKVKELAAWLHAPHLFHKLHTVVGTPEQNRQSLPSKPIYCPESGIYPMGMARSCHPKEGPLGCHPKEGFEECHTEWATESCQKGPVECQSLVGTERCHTKEGFEECQPHESATYVSESKDTKSEKRQAPTVCDNVIPTLQNISSPQRTKDVHGNLRNPPSYGKRSDPPLHSKLSRKSRDSTYVTGCLNSSVSSPKDCSVGRRTKPSLPQKQFMLGSKLLHKRPVVHATRAVTRNRSKRTNMTRQAEPVVMRSTQLRTLPRRGCTKEINVYLEDQGLAVTGAKKTLKRKRPTSRLGRTSTRGVLRRAATPGVLGRTSTRAVLGCTWTRRRLRPRVK